MFWIWYAPKSNKIIAVVMLIMVIIIFYNILQGWNLFMILQRFIASNFIIYVNKNELLPLFMGLLFGLFFWKYDLLKNSESSKNEDIGNHKSDKPIVLKNEKDDYFEVWDKLNAIDDVLTKTDVLLNHKIIALYGDWGSGKSSIVETLSDRYEKTKLETIFNDKPINEELITIKFDAWKYEKEDNLPYALLEFILSELENHKKANWEIKTKIGIIKDKLLKSGRMVFKSMGTNFNFFGIEIGLEQNEDKRKEIDNLFEGFNILSKILKKNNKRLIVFIDDLDRCEVENALNILSSIKLLFASGSNINYICAVDKEAVAEALQHKYNNNGKKAEEYLEKIFNFSFYMPEFSVEKFVKKYEFFNNGDIAKKLANFFEAINFTNPRHLKKVLNKYEYLVNVKTSNKTSDDLKNLIPDILRYPHMVQASKIKLTEYHYYIKKDKKLYDEYLFDTIFVLYFIILYEFYYEIFIKIKQNFEKNEIIAIKCFVDGNAGGNDTTKREIEKISSIWAFGKISIYNIIKRGREYLEGLKFLLLYGEKSKEPIKIFSNGNQIEDVIEHYDIVLDFINYIYYYTEDSFSYSLSNPDYYQKKEEYYKTLASEYPFKNLFEMAETLL
jgi:energy-coupling factor transporter ATP-binding protein EcfA2